MEWYKKLTSEQRYFLKTDCEKICGISWTVLGKIFTPAERIEIIHNKLQIEGIIKN